MARPTSPTPPLPADPKAPPTLSSVPGWWCRCWRKIRTRLFKGREKGVAILILLQICFCLRICAKTVYLHSQRSGHFCLPSIRLRTDFNNKLLLNTHLRKNAFLFQEHVDVSPIVAVALLNMVLFQPKAASWSGLISNLFSYRWVYISAMVSIQVCLSVFPNTKKGTNTDQSFYPHFQVAW